PLGPGTYPIVGKSGGEVQPGQILAGSLTYGTGMYDARGGTLKLDRFDTDGVAGSFVIDGVEALNGSRKFHIEGTFEIPCRGGMLETECRANKARAVKADWRTMGSHDYREQDRTTMAQVQPGTAPRFSLPVKQNRSQKTRDRLLAAGFKLLRRKDFDQLSVADIARAANCAVGSFYQRFFDKDQYFFALAEMRREQSRSQLDEWYDGVKLGSIVERAIKREL